MENRVRYRPFTGDEDLHIRLDAAPLVLVLCQVRWPQLSSLQGDLRHIVEVFGKHLPDYPLYASSSEVSFDLTPAGPIQTPDTQIHHWSRADRSSTVTLSPNFVTLAVREYGGYDSFEHQLAGVLSAVLDTVAPPLFDRVGVRYINRISDPAQVENIDQLVSSELLGHQALRIANDEVELLQAVNQSLFKVGEGYLQARSGIIPQGETVDQAIPPLQQSSWVLDIDSFQQGEAVFGTEAVLARAGALSDAAYDFFKLVIKEAFVDEFGGKV